MIIITCISDNQHPGYKLLSASCDYYGLKLKTLIHRSGWSSHRLKDVYVRMYLETLDPDEVVLFTDGYDALFVSDEEEILNNYRSFGMPVVFSTEINCYPQQALSAEYGVGKTKFQYLNSGGYIGTVSALLNLFDKFESVVSAAFSPGKDSFLWSNQFVWTKIYLHNREEICLDCSCSIFQTFVNRIDIFGNVAQDKETLFNEEISRMLDDFYIENDRLYNKITNSRPSHLHFNGLLSKSLVNSSFLNTLLPWRKPAHEAIVPPSAEVAGRYSNNE